MSRTKSEDNVNSLGTQTADEPDPTFKMKTDVRTKEKINCLKLKNQLWRSTQASYVPGDLNETPLSFLW